MLPLSFHAFMQLPDLDHPGAKNFRLLCLKNAILHDGLRQ
jgi:hypothetical protein